MSRIAQLVLVTSILAAFLAGCGAQADEAGSRPADRAATIEPTVTDKTADEQTRIVKHAMGEAAVPAKPQRVVVLDTGELDSALALGVKPVGAVTALQGQPFQSYLLDQTGGITNVGTIQQPNLEAITALKPDLILSSKLRHEAIYPQLSAIGPTVFTESVGVTWKENFKLHAEALGKSADAEQLMADYQNRLHEFQSAMGDRLNSIEVSTIRFMPGGKVRIYMNASFIGTVLDDAGLSRPAAQDQEKKFAQEVTKEGIPMMDGDVIFVSAYGPVEQTPLEEFNSDPLWSQLSAVKAGAVYEVPDDYWMLGIGIQAANHVVDDLFTYLVENS